MKNKNNKVIIEPEKMFLNADKPHLGEEVEQTKEWTEEYHKAKEKYLRIKIQMTSGFRSSRDINLSKQFFVLKKEGILDGEDPMAMENKISRQEEDLALSSHGLERKRMKPKKSQ